MANDDYDEVDETADPVDDEVEDEAEESGEEEVSAEASSGGSEAPAPRPEVDDAETLTVSSKEALRRQLEEEMARFLAQGGQIKEIPPDVTTDPPQKPVSNYGSKPI